MRQLNATEMHKSDQNLTTGMPFYNVYAVCQKPCSMVLTSQHYTWSLVGQAVRLLMQFEEVAGLSACDQPAPKSPSHSLHTSPSHSLHTSSCISNSGGAPKSKLRLNVYF